MAFKTQTLYANEIERDITCRALSAAGVLRLDRVSRLPNKDARSMAFVLETLRDGVMNYPFPDNDSLVDFVERYPRLAARLFIAIRRLSTES